MHTSMNFPSKSGVARVQHGLYTIVGADDITLYVAIVMISRKDSILSNQVYEFGTTMSQLLSDSLLALPLAINCTSG